MRTFSEFTYARDNGEEFKLSQKSREINELLEQHRKARSPAEKIKLRNILSNDYDIAMFTR